MQQAQPYKFRLVLKDGEVIEGGSESQDLLIDHVRHCLRQDPTDKNPVVAGYSLGRYGRNKNPREIKRL